MQPPDGDRFHLAGEFLEIEPPSRLVYTFRWEEPDPDDRETVVTLSLDEVGDATQVSLSQGEFATEARLELHRSGWTDSFGEAARVDRLERLATDAPRQRPEPMASIATSQDDSGTSAPHAELGIRCPQAQRPSHIRHRSESIRHRRPPLHRLAELHSQPGHWHHMRVTQSWGVALADYSCGLRRLRKSPRDRCAAPPCCGTVER